MEPPGELEILILGDGNFSFSLAFCKLLGCRDMVATSFDSHSDLLDKYPEVEGTLAQLKTKYHCEIIHEVNATLALPQQLKDHRRFNHIVFNYPHLGVEDAVLHARLMGHIFYR